MPCLIPIYLYTFLSINFMTRNRKISGVASKFQSESGTDTERIRCHGYLGTLVIWVQSTSPSASEAHAIFRLRVHRDVIKETGDACMGTQGIRYHGVPAPPTISTACGLLASKTQTLFWLASFPDPRCFAEARMSFFFTEWE